MEKHQQTYRCIEGVYLAPLERRKADCGVNRVRAGEGTELGGKPAGVRGEADPERPAATGRNQPWLTRTKDGHCPWENFSFKERGGKEPDEKKVARRGIPVRPYHG